MASTNPTKNKLAVTQITKPKDVCKPQKPKMNKASDHSLRGGRAERLPRVAELIPSKKKPSYGLPEVEPPRFEKPRRLPSSSKNNDDSKIIAKRFSSTQTLKKAGQLPALKSSDVQPPLTTRKPLLISRSSIIQKSSIQKPLSGQKLLPFPNSLIRQQLLLTSTSVSGKSPSIPISKEPLILRLKAALKRQYQISGSLSTITLNQTLTSHMPEAKPSNTPAGSITSNSLTGSKPSIASTEMRPRQILLSPTVTIEPLFPASNDLLEDHKSNINNHPNKVPNPATVADEEYEMLIMKDPVYSWEKMRKLLFQIFPNPSSNYAPYQQKKN